MGTVCTRRSSEESTETTLLSGPPVGVPYFKVFPYVTTSNPDDVSRPRYTWSMASVGCLEAHSVTLAAAHVLQEPARYATRPGGGVVIETTKWVTSTCRVVRRRTNRPRPRPRSRPKSV